MAKTQNNLGGFNQTDIVVFDEIITTYSIFKSLNIPDDEIRMANEWEVAVYNNRPES